MENKQEFRMNLSEEFTKLSVVLESFIESLGKVDKSKMRADEKKSISLNKTNLSRHASVLGTPNLA